MGYELFFRHIVVLILANLIILIELTINFSIIHFNPNHHGFFKQNRHAAADCRVRAHLDVDDETFAQANAVSGRWGTIKNVRYAKKEVKCDGEFRYAMGFSGWFINNDKHTFFYDKTTHTITEKQSEGKKTYTFEEYDEVVQERKQTDFFEPYVFDVR